MDFAGKTIWITGASSGIGRGLAEAFSGQGAHIILSGRREGALAEVADACAGETLVLPFEATAYDALPAIVETAEDWKGGVDILVNNAGISQRSVALDTDFEVYRRLMEVDFFAPLKLTQLLLPRMVERGIGHFVQISSVAGKVGSPLRTGYCAAKHALTGYSDALRAEIDQFGLEVTVVTPGFVQTGIAENALDGSGQRYGPNDDPVNQGISPAAAAEQILSAMKAGKREVPVGRRGAPEMALLTLKRLFPNMIFDRMTAMAPKRGG
ncbi:MAG: SDR family NAD(P)-dependent oxidoreductase [Pacificimonas sp.]|jgi:short-subunit dehydrogenase|nr:SDR family NAD(P)-dependent oxidoreductase [Pacificimonas sp.]